MKHRFLILILLAATHVSVYSQTVTKKIADEFLTYFNTIKNHQFDKSLAYMPDEMFDITPKQTLLEMMESTLNNPQMPMSFKDVKVIAVDLPILIGKKHYSLIKYSTILSITITASSVLANTDSEVLLKAYADAYGENNVKFFAGDNRYELYYEKNVCAISPNGTSDWRFVELEPKELEILKNFIPSQILNRL